MGLAELRSGSMQQERSFNQYVLEVAGKGSAEGAWGREGGGEEG